MRTLRHHEVPPGAQGPDPHGPSVRLQGGGVGVPRWPCGCRRGSLTANESGRESNQPQRLCLGTRDPRPPHGEPRGPQTPWDTRHAPVSHGTRLCPGLSQGARAEEAWAQLTTRTCSGGEAGPAHSSARAGGPLTRAGGKQGGGRGSEARLSGGRRLKGSRRPPGALAALSRHV